MRLFTHGFSTEQTRTIYSRSQLALSMYLVRVEGDVTFPRSLGHMDGVSRDRRKGRQDGGQENATYNYALAHRLH